MAVRWKTKLALPTPRRAARSWFAPDLPLRGSQCPTTLVLAPAGLGKTSL